MTNDVRKNEEYRNQLKNLVEKAKGMYQKGEYRNPEYGELCMAVVRLIENSEYGRREAESELALKVESWYNQLMDDSFDGVIIQYLNMCDQYLGAFGKVSVEPYSNGLGTRSARATFKPKQEE